jgi:hypothetical protein
VPQFERRLIAFGGVKHNPRRLLANRPQRSAGSFHQVIGAGLIGDREAVLNAQAVAVQIVLGVLLYRPDVGDREGGANRYRGAGVADRSLPIDGVGS